MDLTTARAEMESWLRALAAPMAPIHPADVPAVEAVTRPGNAGAPTAAGLATPLARRETPAAGGADPADLVERAIETLSLGGNRDAQQMRVPGSVAGGSAPSQGPTASTGDLPANVLRPSAPKTASAGSDRSVDHGVTSADSDKMLAQPHDQRVTGDIGKPIPRSGRPTGWAAAPADLPDPWPSGRDSRGVGPDSVADAVDAALAPLLPPPAAPVGSRTPEATPPDTVDDLRAHARHDLADLTDLADLLAGVLEDETRALGVLELEP